MNPHVYGQMTFDKTIQWEKQSFQQMVHKNWISTCKVMTLESQLTRCTELKSKHIKNLNVRTKAIKVLEDNTGQNLHAIEFGNNFLDTTPKAQLTKTKTKRQTGLYKTF